MILLCLYCNFIFGLYAPVMLKLSKGQGVGPLKEQWYHFAKNLSLVTLPMYGIEVDKLQYEEAMDAIVSCKLRRHTIFELRNWCI